MFDLDELIINAASPHRAIGTFLGHLIPNRNEIFQDILTVEALVKFHAEAILFCFYYANMVRFESVHLLGQRGRVVSASDSGSGGRGFDSRPSHVAIALGKQFTLTFPSPPTCKMGTQLQAMS